MNHFTINARGKLLSLDKPVVMGILNLTPDSFFKGSRSSDVSDAIERVKQMLDEGATFIDIGAASSRPGADVISEQEERDRLMPVFRELVSAFPEAIFSIDTWRVRIAGEVLEAGAHIINDISAGTLEPEIVEVAAQAEAPFVAMHMRGTPGKMPLTPSYEDIAADILKFFVQRLRILRDGGIRDVILDPGFGFGKSAEDNFDLLRRLEVFNFLEIPMLVGLSRKSLVWKTLNITPEQALNGTTALHMIALQKGAKILRVHDVREAVEVIALFKAAGS